MYTYEKIDDTSYKITGPNYNSVFKCDENRAKELVADLIEKALVSAYGPKIIELHEKYDKWLADYKAKFANGEVASFEDKRKEALAWNLDNTIATPICDAIAAGAGIDREAYLQSVLDKVTFIATQEGKMLAIRDQLKACSTVDEINAITIPDFPVGV